VTTQPTDVKQCPYCAETILAAAIKCKHCGSDLTRPAAGDPAVREPRPPVGGPATRETAPQLDGLRVSASDAPVGAAEVLYEGPGSQIQNLGIYAVCVLISILGFAISATRGVIVVGFIVLGVCCLLAAVGYMKVAYRRYRISTGRMEVQSGVITTKTENVLMIRVKDIRFRQTISDRLFGLGTIDVLSSDEIEPDLTFCAIPDAKRIYQALSAETESIARQHGVVRY
jgi:membrane protein YdbS with pleckstrin-like domain